MALADDITALRDRVMADLNTAHDYYTDTKIAGKKVDFQEVLNAQDKNAITILVIDKELADMLRGTPAAWFKYLEDRAKLGCPTPEEIQRFAEAKASRDVLEHNRGVANRTYESKAGKLARYNDGQKVDIPEHYHRETWELIRKIITDIANAAIAKTA